MLLLLAGWPYKWIPRKPTNHLTNNQINWTSAQHSYHRPSKKPKEMIFSEFRQNITECVNLAKYKGERFLIKRNGKSVGVFVSIEDLEKIEELEKEEILN